MASGAKSARVAGRFAVLDSQTKTSTLFRLAGLSALLAGVCYTLVGIFHPANIPASVTTSTSSPASSLALSSPAEMRGVLS